MARSRARSASPPSSATSAAFLLSVCTYEPTTVGAFTRVTRRTVRFSPILAISARRRSSTVSPLDSFSALTASTLPAPADSAALATSLANPRNSSPRATKSVSLFTSTSTPVLPSADFSTTTTPSAATREAFLSALASPALRMFSAAASRSPLVSTSAFLHSIMPAPVRSRSCLTASAVIVITFPLVSRGHGSAAARATTTTATAGGRVTGAGTRAAGTGRGAARRIAAVLESLGAVFRLRGNARNHRTAARGATGMGRATGADRRRRLGSASTLRTLLLRVALLVELDEFVFAHDHGRNLRLAFDHGVGDASGVQRDGAHGVVVARDDVVDFIGSAVGIDHRDHRDAELLGFVDGNVLVAHVDHEDHVRRRFHLLDAAEALLELVLLTAHHRGFFLATFAEGTVFRHLGEIREPLDGLTDGLEIGEHAAQPALVHEGHLATASFLLHSLARRALGADEQHFAAVRDHAAHEPGRFRVHGLRLLEVDDMDLVSFAENERSHLRVPEAGLVSEMDARFQHLSHRHAGHQSLLGGLSLRAARVVIQGRVPRHPSTRYSGQPGEAILLKTGLSVKGLGRRLRVWFK